MNGKETIATVVMSLILLGALMIGFWLTGSPLTLENQRVDNARLSDFSFLHEAIQEYANANGNPPANLSDLPASAQKNTKDPSTGKPFDYVVTSSSSFNLCATFFDDSMNKSKSYSYIANHTKGYDCIPFTLTYNK